ncbi:MAG: VOC family protein [Pirellulaceae bacterium]
MPASPPPPPSPPPAASLPPPLRAVLETSLYVDDLVVAERFYCQLLGLELYSRQEGRHVFLRCGSQMVLLFDARSTQDSTTSFPPHGAEGAGHVAFSINQRDLAGWRKRLSEAQVPIEQEIEWSEGVTSLYFRDPAGNSLELASPRLWRLPETPSTRESATE